jgi:MFS family permease
VNGTLAPAAEVLAYNGLAALLAEPAAWKLIALVFIQMVFVAMVYGPIAAYLVEAFPARIRYTALSLPYHIGNGVFGGLLPLIGLSVIATTGNITAGLYYPIGIAALTFVVGTALLKDTHQRRIWDEVSR